MNAKYIQWVLVAVALVVGLVGGYFYGNSKGVAKEKSTQEAAAKKGAEDAAAAVNPFSQTTANPFEKSPVNPYENVNINPFK